MDLARTRPTPPKGLAFEIVDLVRLLGWAKFHEARILVELDHCLDGDEYEEVVACYTKDSRLRRWTMWRDGAEIIVQPLMGRGRRFPTVAAALANLIAA